MSKQRRCSDYQHALSLARKARRRGDAIASERWSKQAHRFLTSNRRFQAFLRTEKQWEAEREQIRAQHEERREQLLARAERMLDDAENGDVLDYETLGDIDESDDESLLDNA